MLNVIFAGSAEERSALINETMHPALLEKYGVDAIAGLAENVREELGDYRLLGIRPFPEDRVDIEFDTVQGVMAVELGLDKDADELKVRGIGLRVGD